MNHSFIARRFRTLTLQIMTPPWVSGLGAYRQDSALVVTEILGIVHRSAAAGDLPALRVSAPEPRTLSFSTISRVEAGSTILSSVLCTWAKNSFFLYRALKPG